MTRTVSAPHEQSPMPSPEGKAVNLDETMEEVGTRQTATRRALPIDEPRPRATRRDLPGTVSGTRSCSTPRSIRSAIPADDDRALYFIENPALGLIKIGITASVEVRLKSLEAGCGVPLRLLQVVPGFASYEGLLLDAFSESRRLGEWFDDTPALRELIDNPAAIVEHLAYLEDSRRSA